MTANRPDRKVVTLHLPMDVELFGVIAGAVAAHFPGATVSTKDAVDTPAGQDLPIYEPTEERRSALTDPGRRRLRPGDANKDR